MTPEDQQRIEFAERLGQHKVALDNPLLANPTSYEDVHNALMGMSEGEWMRFCDLVWRNFPEVQHPSNVIYCTFKTPLSTLVECFLEATKGRVK